MSTNLFAVFRNLIPTRPLQVAEVTAAEDMNWRVEFPGGGQATVRGTASIGQQVYVRDGLIEGQAPTLPVDLIEV